MALLSESSHDLFLKGRAHESLGEGIVKKSR